MVEKEISPPGGEIFFHHPVMPGENFVSVVVAPPQRPTAAILYSNPHGCQCTLSGVLHGCGFGSTDT